jgi:hypothetical protein
VYARAACSSGVYDDTPEAVVVTKPARLAVDDDIDPKGHAVGAGG